MSELLTRLEDAPYQAYAYSYPHKSAYASFPAPIDLATLWRGEDRSAMFCYIHIPFCTYRCGFCNLFALGQPGAELVERYVDQLVNQMEVMGDLLGERRFARFAIGGGTPSYLATAQLQRLFDATDRHLDVDLRAIPCGIEVSPETATPDRLAACRDAGVDRVSMGVQSFDDAELAALVRPTQTASVLLAVESIRTLGFPTLNLDLIYGIPGQSRASFLASLRTMLSLAPEELYLYPLYVRPQTGMNKLQRRAGSDPADSDHRRELYQAGRDLLLEAGYAQVSMRLFRAAHAPDSGGPVYCCQDDGMLGIGCGARSYTRGVHYSDHYAVARTGVSAILRRYVEQAPSEFTIARYGFALDEDEQRRRYVIQSLLTWPGLDLNAYARRFGAAVDFHFPQLCQLEKDQLALRAGTTFALTAEGMTYADAIGPWLNSSAVRECMTRHAAA